MQITYSKLENLHIGKTLNMVGSIYQLKDCQNHIVTNGFLMAVTILNNIQETNTMQNIF